MPQTRQHSPRVGFVIAGAQKGGTTALCHFLNQHPSVECLPEPHYFDHLVEAEGYADYEARFQHAGAGTALGDCTPSYMYLEGVPERICRYNPAMKVLVLLRNPVDRAYSQYRMNREEKEEGLPFLAALLREDARLTRAREVGDRHEISRHSYKDRGRYVAQIERLRTLFGKERVLVLLNEDLRTAHEATLRRVFAFIGVEDQAVELPRAKAVHQRSYGPMSALSRSLLRRVFREEILRLQDCLDRDLTAWLS